MCIRDRYQRRVHGEQIHTLFVDLLRQKTRILILSGALDSVVPPEGTANQLFSLVKKGLLNKITTSKPIFAQDEFVGIVNEYTVEGEQGLQFVVLALSLIHISEPTRQAEISYAVFCLKKKK
eukprot:TRINITY_DN1401_c0_g1_i6.p2 TRINITY_DN1401_c0_g1~~TRINITY_DN1401_c0_g1_i6.p2  ORF type:complete len:122 (-),score=49.63 TRINITY_DN1401_c0_g1_i6:18-383(-)